MEARTDTLDAVAERYAEAARTRGGIARLDADTKAALASGELHRSNVSQFCAYYRSYLADPRSGQRSTKLTTSARSTTSARRPAGDPTAPAPSVAGRGADVHLLKSGEVDPTDPAPGQPWQSRANASGNGGKLTGDDGKVCRISHLRALGGGDSIVFFHADESHYVLASNLRRYWRHVGHLPEAALHVDGDVAAPLVRSWFEFVVALERVAGLCGGQV